jgi:uncharacterized repeat protein (TIGR03803 family)
MKPCSQLLLSLRVVVLVLLTTISGKATNTPPVIVAGFDIVAAFSGANGDRPESGLTLGRDGFLYGIAYDGGTNWPGGTWGSMFKMSTQGKFAWSVGFARETGDPVTSGLSTDGRYLYGTGRYGGSNDMGTVFRCDTNGVLAVLHSFTGVASTNQGDDGTPVGGVVRASDGFLWGATIGDGFTSMGSIFRIAPDGSFSVLRSLNGCDDGTLIAAPFTEAPDGALYGIAAYGGSACYPAGFGVIFRVTTNGTTPLYNFQPTDGWGGSTGLAPGDDGKLYGTCLSGGTTNLSRRSGGPGTVFRISTNGIFERLYGFDGGTNGANPTALVRGCGKFYGMTERGGTQGKGTIFVIGTNGILTTLYSFPSDVDGPGLTPVMVGGTLYNTLRAASYATLGLVFKYILPPPRLRDISRSDGVTSLGCDVEQGLTYKLQFSDSTQPESWQDLGGIFTATASTMQFNDECAGSTRFYRAVLVP